ncbi:hypothetical protein D9M70_601580 [compost metagenome]
MAQLLSLTFRIGGTLYLCKRSARGTASQIGTHYASISASSAIAWAGIVCWKVTGKQIVYLVCNFGPIRSLDLFHDVADMNLDCALPKVEFIGNDLVGLSSP